MKKIIVSQLELIIFGIAIILNIKVKAIEKHYRLRNVFIKLDHD